MHGVAHCSPGSTFFLQLLPVPGAATTEWERAGMHVFTEQTVVGASLFEQLDGTTHLDAILGVEQTRFINDDALAKRICSAELSKAEIAFLDLWNIPHTKFPSGRIPHPAWKAMENAAFLVDLPHCTRFSPVIVNTKPAKFARVSPAFAARHGVAPTLCNVVLTAKDQVRFLTNVAAQVPLGRDSYVLHDAAQFMSPANVVSFMLDTGAQELIVTLPLAVETLDGMASSAPAIYQLRYHGDRVFHYPPGNPTEGYDQPLSARWWLTTNSLRVEDTVYSVELLRSSGFHHILRVSLGPPAESRRMYAIADVVRVPAPDGAPLLDPWLPTEAFVSLMDYARCPTKLDARSIASKVRSLQRSFEFAATSAHAQAALRSLISHVHMCQMRLSHDTLFASWPRRMWLQFLQWLVRDLPLGLQEYLGVGSAQYSRILALSEPRRWYYFVEAEQIEVFEYDCSPLLCENDVPEAETPDGPGDADDLDEPRGPLPPAHVPFIVLPGQAVADGAEELPLVATYFGLEPRTTCFPDFRQSQLVLPEPVDLTPDILRACFTQIFVEANVSNARLIAAYNRASPLFTQTDREDNLLSDPPRLSMHGLHLLALALDMSLHMTYTVRPLNAPVTLGLIRAPPALSAVVRYHANGDGHFELVRVGEPHRGERARVDQQMEALAAYGASPRSAQSVFATIATGLPRSVFQPSRARAKALFNELEAGITFNLRTHPKFISALPSWEAACKIPVPGRTVKMVYIAGHAGCGKSYSVAAALRNAGTLGPWLLLISPLAALNKQWSSKLALTAQNQFVCQTLEKALFRSCELLIVDEAQKFPCGYLDLYLAIHPSVKRIVLLGDPRQAGPAVLDARSLLDPRASVGRELAPSISVFYDDSYRMNPEVAHRLQIDTFRHASQGRIVQSGIIDPKLPLIVPSVREQAIHSNNDRQAYTYSSCGGLDFNTPVQVLVGSLTGDTIGPEAVYTAFTRTSHDVIVVTSCSRLELTRSVQMCPILGVLLGFSPPRDLNSFIPLAIPAAVVQPSRAPPLFYCGGRNNDEALSSAVALRYGSLGPFLASSFQPPIILPSTVEPNCPDVEEPESLVIPTTLPPLPGNVLLSLADCVDPESAEYFEGLETTSINHSETIDVLSARHIFQHHSNKQPALRKPTIKARLLTVRNHVENQREYKSKKFLGPLLASAFARRHGIAARVALDEQLKEECQVDAMRVFLEKPIARLVNLEGDNDPAAVLSHARLFIKSQFVTKPNTEPLPVAEDPAFDLRQQNKLKPGQTIVDLHKHLSGTFGVWTRYLERALARVSTSPSLHMSGKTPTDFAKWTAQHYPAQCDTMANDYTRYDQSCRGETLAFEVAIMRLFSVPEDIIDLHFRMVTELSIGAILVGTMRNSGQWCTLLFNTWYNEAVCELKFDMDGVPACYCGDDMLAMRVPPLRTSWSMVERFFSLRAKIVISRVGDFCGWLVFSTCITRNPGNLYLKMLFHESRGGMDDVLLSYLLEFERVYVNLDCLAQYVDDHTLGCALALLQMFRSYRASIPRGFRNSVIFRAGHSLGWSDWEHSKATARELKMVSGISKYSSVSSDVHKASLLLLAGASPYDLNDVRYSNMSMSTTLSGSTAQPGPASLVGMATGAVNTAQTGNSSSGFSSGGPTNALAAVSSGPLARSFPAMFTAFRPFPIRLKVCNLVHMTADAASFNLRNASNFITNTSSFSVVEMSGLKAGDFGPTPFLRLKVLPSPNSRGNFRLVVAAVPSLATKPKTLADLVCYPGAVTLSGGAGMGGPLKLDDKNQVTGVYTGPIAPTEVDGDLMLPVNCSPLLKPIIVSDLAWELYYYCQTHVETTAGFNAELYAELFVTRTGDGFGSWVGT